MPKPSTEASTLPPKRIVIKARRAGQNVATLAALMVLAVVAAISISSTRAQAAPTEYGIWPSATVPKLPDDPDASSVELGVRFSSSTDGWVTGIRYYKSAANTGVHAGTLWSGSGTKLAGTTFTAETTKGWQEARFGAAVRVTKGSTYVASYRAPQGRYAADIDALSPAKPVTNYALTATQGLYTYGSAMPKNVWKNANYYVDVDFTVVNPSAATTVTTTSSTSTITHRPTSTPPSTPTTRPTTSRATPPPTSTSPPGGATSTLFPSAGTTGVPVGVRLRASGSISINTDGAVIDALDIKGTVTINASNVTLKRSRVAGRGFAVIRVTDRAKNVTIQDVEVNGLGKSGEGGSMGIIGPATVLRSNIYGVENGVSPNSGSVVQDNYIHSLSAPGDPHIDGIQMDGSLSKITVEHNTIDMREWTQTAAVMIDNYFGPIDTIKVNNNLLMGGGYTVYSDGRFSGGTIKNVSITNNRFVKGHWGYASIDVYQPTWSNNLDHTTGNVIKP